ncbi:uncharacterized protein LOC135386185 [Ornithodoros turicata]|uniref:uncharacterized protein LOC135386185 n=1 Tax=Ornithodoros turicata TaxID=34597 RepID=UPI00313A3406
MARNIYSEERVFCADYARRHQKRILRQSGFTTVSSLDIDALKALLDPERRDEVCGEDQLCKNCVAYFRSAISGLSQSSPVALSDTDYVQSEDIIEEINKSISTANIDVTPLRQPASLKRKQMPSYASRKRREVGDALSRSISRRISDAYDIDEPTTSGKDCTRCSSLLRNIRTAYQKCTTNQGRCQILTLLPENMTKKEIVGLIPDATKYVIEKSKSLKGKQGVWAMPDKYGGHPVSENDVQVALRYYLEDEKDCSVQSPNKKDVIHVTRDGKRVAVAKRFMTRSIRETFSLLKSAHPDINIGLTKFYTLRPKWVRTDPRPEQCVCLYCANFDLIIAAINSASSIQLSRDQLNAMSVCPEPQRTCFLQECRSCQGAKTINLQKLRIERADDVDMALWESGDLIRKTLKASIFLKAVRKCAALYTKHEYIYNIQRSAIWNEKAFVDPRHVIMHFDFAENWRVNFSSEVQGRYWKTDQISLFTCVVTTMSSTKSFATVSDDLSHDTAHALLALQNITEAIEDILPVFSHVIYVSDGAAAHFKNRYQLYEMGKNNLLLRWIFSASGHGKNACDGVGGSLKHIASLHNLRCPPAEAIQTAEDFVCALKKKEHATELLHIPSVQVAAFRNSKKDEWELFRPVTGIRSSHVWYKASEGHAVSGVQLARTAEDMFEPRS